MRMVYQIPDLARDHGISTFTRYHWRAKYGGIDASMMKRLKELEADEGLPEISAILNECFGH